MPVGFDLAVDVPDPSFTARHHRGLRADGNPLNEGRMLCSSITDGHDTLQADSTIKYDAAKSVLKLAIGDEIPTTGSYPSVLIWADAFGLRPAMRDMGRRLAAEGYSVLVPNPFYRVAKAPVFESAATVNFQDPATRAKLQSLMGSINAAQAAEKDAAAYVAFLDAQSQVDKAKKIGTQGYCMGGALVMRTAAALPGRVGAGASFHGGGLVTDKPDSPHLLAPKIVARMYFGIASNDDQRQPDAKDKLKKAFEDAKVRAEIEVYPAKHGWCMPDSPSDNGTPIYSRPGAERAWGKLVALYKTALI